MTYVEMLKLFQWISIIAVLSIIITILIISLYEYIRQFTDVKYLYFVDYLCIDINKRKNTIIVLDSPYIDIDTVVDNIREKYDDTNVYVQNISFVGKK
jgi:hypothetical protein